jgi:hypothetical protein
MSKPEPLSPADKDRLIKLLGMMGSDHMGERAVAAAKADELIRSHGMTWADVVLPTTAAAAPKAPKQKKAKAEAKPTRKPRKPTPAKAAYQAARDQHREAMRAERLAVIKKLYDDYSFLFTDWECEFLEGVYDQVRDNNFLTEKQRSIIDRLRWKVSKHQQEQAA